MSKIELGNIKTINGEKEIISCIVLTNYHIVIENSEITATISMDRYMGYLNGEDVDDGNPIIIVLDESSMLGASLNYSKEDGLFMAYLHYDKENKKILHGNMIPYSGNITLDVKESLLEFVTDYVFIYSDI